MKRIYTIDGVEQSYDDGWVDPDGYQRHPSMADCWLFDLFEAVADTIVRIPPIMWIDRLFGCPR